MSDWFIDALTPAMDQIGVPKQFAGLVIVAIAGNAVENTAGVVLALKGEADLAISVVKNSVAQIAAFLYPALVLVSLLFATRLTFGLSGVYIGALLLTGARAPPDHGRRGGDPVRGGGAHLALRDPRRAGVLRVNDRPPAPRRPGFGRRGLGQVSAVRRLGRGAAVVDGARPGACMQVPDR